MESLKNPHLELLEKMFGKNFFAEKETFLNLIYQMQTGEGLQEKVVPASKEISLTQIRCEIGDCTRCKLSTTRTNIVYARGNPNSALMFVGEGPGEQEDLSGDPFVGKAGQLLDKIIGAMGYGREDVYIANVVKCRPPQNRTPEPDEVETCSPFLEKQIKTVSPRVLVALGATALKYLCGPQSKISKQRGEFLSYQGIPVMPTFHPAYLLRNPEAKKEVWDDMKKVIEFLRK